MTIENIIDNLHQLPEISKQSLIKCIEEVHFPKGYILLRADRIERNIYFIKQGIVRAYTQTAENDITFWFGKEGDTVISMNSYVMNQKGYEDVELLENCILYKLKTDDLKSLFNQDIYIANWGRRFAEHELIKTEERLIFRQFRSAKERYIDLLNNRPGLLQRVQLGFIASYLGITQVSLSRIRAEIK